MSDFLAAMEARNNRRSAPAAPVAAVVVGLILAFIGAFFLVPFTLEGATRLAGGLASPAQVGTYFASVVGIALAAATVLWAAVYFPFVRPARPRWAVELLVGIVALMMAVSLATSFFSGAVAERQEQQRIAAAEMERVFSRFLADGLEADLGDTRPKARGEPGRVERLAKENLADIVKVARKYDHDIRALKLDVLSPADVARSDIGEVRARLRKATLLTVVYRNDVEEVLKKSKARTDAADISASSRRMYAQGFAEGLAESQARIDRIVDLQLELIDLTSEQLEFLQSRRGRWVVLNDRVLFGNMADVQEFNRVATSIQRTAAEMESIKQGQRGRMTDLRDRMSEAAR